MPRLNIVMVEARNTAKYGQRGAHLRRYGGKAAPCRTYGVYNR